MAKLKEISMVSVMNVESQKELSVRATQTPRKNEVGVYFTPKLNQLGIAQLQAKHPEVTNTKEMEALISNLLGINTKGFGSIDAWKTEEERAKWVVKINNEVYNPEVVVKTEVETPQPVTAVADTTTNSDAHNIDVIRNALTTKGYDRAIVMEMAVKKFGEAKAQELMALAETPAEQPKAEDIFGGFDTGVQSTAVTPPKVEAPEFDFGN